MAWQPIETAPKQERYATPSILLGFDKDNGVYPMQWMQSWYGNEVKACWIDANLDEEYGCPIAPTHWCELPRPPKI